MPAGEGLRAGAAAVAFLTRVPVGRLLVLGGDDVTRGALLFPVVGAAIGAAVGGTAAGLGRILPALPSAGLALALGALLTGALHLDALADTADSLAARSRERALAIMRDHAVGAYGATALVLDLLLKAAALAALVPHGWRIVTCSVAAGALSRTAPVVLGAALPSVREDGAGAAFRVTPAQAAATCLLGAGLAFAAGTTAAGTFVGVTAVLCLLLGGFFRRRLGGGTGDTLGAAAELTETAVLLAAVALL